MLLAKGLQKENTIGIIVPSWPCTQEKYEEVLKLISYLQSLDLRVKLAENFTKTDLFHTSGWTPEERANDFNSMVLDPEISAIWCLQWGETVNQIIDLIDYESLKRNPKIIIWKSDIDVLHNSIYTRIWLVTFHWPDAKIWNKWEMELEYTQRAFYARLFQKEKIIESSDIKSRYALVEWRAQWRIIGCNLVSILKLAWTSFFPDFSEDYIFFIETYKYEAKSLTARLEHLRMLWVFQKCRWIVIGSNYWFDENVWKAEDVVVDFFKDFKFPIIKTNEFGHYQPHCFLPIGAEVSIDTDTLEIKIESEFLI